MRRKLIPLLVVSFVLLGAKPSLALTLSDTRTAIRRNVRDTASSTSLRRYSDAVLLTFVNESQRNIINETWASSDSTSTTVSAGTIYYSLPTEAIKVWRVTLGGANLVELDLTQLDADNYDSSWGTSGTPTSFFTTRSRRTEIGLQPYPSTSGGSLIIYYFQMVPDLSSDSDVPFDSDYRLYSYHDLIVFYVSARILLSENRITEAEAYLKLYSAGLQTMALNVGHKPQRNIATAKEVKP